MSAPPAVLLFDLDGTLIATKRLYLECYRRALAPFFGREPSDAELLALKPRSEVRLLRSQVDDAALAGCFEAFYRAYEELHPSLFEGVYDGVRDMLRALRRARRPLGIVTGKSRRAWRITRAHARLGRFDVVVLDDDVPAAKPDPAGIRLAVERLGVSAAGTLYVGDTLSDVRAAAAAGVQPVAALWSKRETERTSFASRAAAEGALVAGTPLELARALT